MQFIIGFIVGLIIMGLITLWKPLYLTGVQNELVKQEHGYYNYNTGSFILKECK